MESFTNNVIRTIVLQVESLFAFAPLMSSCIVIMNFLDLKLCNVCKEFVESTISFIYSIKAKGLMNRSLGWFFLSLCMMFFGAVCVLCVITQNLDVKYI
jgi:EamA domain-containing membrane protein RarD